ncbi:MarR family transcriptional regulator [Nocardia flavorosea]|uniref:MarR family transcriptional regulator n=1 Tax=Nocardia flavorosea TaxID=53429 RepID=A0A846YMN5_9NOCA|nr:helix-turn-helix domain-containing protein [Nocardia flavorosea]NKY60367.1 MarR family transcriptional regulator [Nocardia flavorosea]
MARNRRHIPVEKLVETQEKRNYALELRLSGMTQAQIVRETGWSKQNVSKYIKDAIADITRENAEEYLELELQRLDEMWAAIWGQIVDPDSDDEYKRQTWNIDRALAIMEQRAKLTGSYKAAELKAIAEAKGGLATETASMIGNFFGRLEELVAAEQATVGEQDDEPDTDEPGESE